MDLNRDGNHDQYESCPVCTESMQDREVVTLDCGHAFHAVCVVEWFRRKGSCPLCRDNVDPEERNSYRNLKAQFMLKKRLSKRKDAPKELKDLVKQHKKKMARLKENRKEFREWKKTEEGARFKELNKKFRKLQNRSWMWSSFRHRRCVERQIAQFPVVSMIMPTRKRKKKEQKENDSR